MQGGTGSAADYGLTEGLVSLDHSDAAAELAANMKRDKDAAFLGEDALCGKGR